MPPKTKKDAQQQAKRLQQQKKRKQQQQARLQLERKKYLAQKLSTGLYLLASKQLIIDFPHKSKQFITEKLKQAFKQAFPQVLQSKRLDFVIKELHYFIKDSGKLFGEVLTAGQEKDGSDEAKIWKRRVFVGIMGEILLFGDRDGNGTGKKKQQDQKRIKQLVTIHCNKMEDLQPLSKSDGLKILQYAKQAYFSHYNLLKFFDKFPKRQTQTQFPLYLQTPNTYFNTEATPFTDLSNNKEEENKNNQQKAV